MLFLAGSLAFFLNIAKKNYNIDPPLALHPKQNLDACTAGVILFLYCFCLEAE
jgi:hypothetical protein